MSDSKNNSKPGKGGDKPTPTAKPKASAAGTNNPVETAAEKLDWVNAKLDAKVLKEIKGSIFSKVCPQGHFKGVGIETQREVAEEAARQLLADGKWELKACKDSTGTTTFIIVETKK